MSLVLKLKLNNLHVFRELLITWREFEKSLVSKLFYSRFCFTLQLFIRICRNHLDTQAP